jgi:predicted metal-dependent hydrolase
MKETDIQKFIEEKKDWIKRKQVKVLEDARPPRQYVEGETFLYLGKEIPLRIVRDQKTALVIDGVFKLTTSAQPQAESHFEAWYKEQARRVLTERAIFFAHSHNIKPGKIRISSAKTRWGSCSPKKTLSFTWRLVMAPLEIIDYVVVHELCHLEEMNHSKAFWARVEAILPDYKVRRQWLKNNGTDLRL